MRVVLDTNVWLSHLLSKGRVNQLVTRLFVDVQALQLFHSDKILEEFSEVGTRKFRVLPSEMQLMTTSIGKNSTLVTPTTLLPTLCRDPDDNHILQLCESVQAEILLTGDQDLLVPSSYLSTRILSPAQLATEMGLE